MPNVSEAAVQAAAEYFRTEQAKPVKIDYADMSVKISSGLE